MDTMTSIRWVFVLLAVGAFGRGAPARGETPGVAITVDLSTVSRTMAAGIGASWHAIDEPIPVAGDRSHGGSAWGANPPASYEARWSQVFRHARWLGLDFCRIEIDHRMYEPERGRFTWDGPEMRVLYRILDYCERTGVEVFLQQMWENVDWNAFPEWRGDPSWRVHSGPASLADFAVGFTALTEHLVRKRRYGCIRWLSITNEPGYDWSWWNRPPNVPMPLAPGLEAVRLELDRRGIQIPLSGPDWTDLPALDPSKIDFDRFIGAYDIHSYYARFDWMEEVGYPMSAGMAHLRDWAEWAHARNKPLFLSELGTMAFGWGGSHPGPGTYEAGLKDAEMVVRAINAGVDGLNRWSFTNRGDLDGQWQLIDTWDTGRNALRERITPHPNVYYLYGLLSRFAARRSAVVGCSLEGGALAGTPRVFATALRSPTGEITLMAVNDAPQAWNARISVNGTMKRRTLYRYQITRDQKARVDARVDPAARFELRAGKAVLTDSLPASSVVVYSTYRRNHDDEGVVR
jgi:hypothetical protein